MILLAQKYRDRGLNFDKHFDKNWFPRVFWVVDYKSILRWRIQYGGTKI